MSIIPRRLTWEEVNALQGALRYDDDVTNCPAWDNTQEILEYHHPELLAAVRNLDIAERTLKAIVENLEAPYEE